jgi:hypothetical protein
MPAKRIHDKPELIARFMTAKSENHLLQLKDWCREQNLSYNTMKRLIGPHVTLAWERAAAIAQKKLENKIGGKLADQVVNTLNVSRQAFASGMAGILPENASFKPATFQDHLKLAALGQQGIIGTAALLTGREPMAVSEGGAQLEGVDWVGEARQGEEKTPRRRKRTKPKPKK